MTKKATKPRKTGRPTKYTPALQERAEHYLEQGFVEQDDLVPSLAGLCCYLDISRTAARDYNKMYPAFSTTLEKIQLKQERMLLTGGLSNRMNSTITKLMLVNHGYSDKQEIDHTTAGESLHPQRIEIVGVDDKDDAS